MDKASKQQRGTRQMEDLPVAAAEVVGGGIVVIEKTSVVDPNFLSPGVVRGFNPQPDPPKTIGL
jgi:hypothetical protein